MAYTGGRNSKSRGGMSNGLLPSEHPWTMMSRAQNPPSVRTCGFKSRPRHQKFSSTFRALAGLFVMANSPAPRLTSPHIDRNLDRSFSRRALEWLDLARGRSVGQILIAPRHRVNQITLAHDVVAVEHGAVLVPGKLHRDPLRHPGAHHIADGRPFEVHAPPACPDQPLRPPYPTPCANPGTLCRRGEKRTSNPVCARPWPAP